MAAKSKNTASYAANKLPQNRHSGNIAKYKTVKTFKGFVAIAATNLI